MYEYKRAIAKKKYTSERYIEVDIRNVKLLDVATGYSDVYLIVTHPNLDGEVSVDWSNLQKEHNLWNPSTTVLEWLEQRGNLSLPLMDSVPEFNTKYVEFRDIWDTGYSVTPVSKGLPKDSPEPVDKKDDILLEKEGVNYDHLYHYHLPTVNGLVHLPDFSTDGYYIVDGNITALNSNTDMIGMLSFENIGKLKFHNVNSSNIYTNGEGLRDYVLVEFDEDIQDKIIIMVLNGYLHVTSPHVNIYNEKTIKVDIHQLPMMERYFETINDLDWGWFRDIMVSDTDNPSHIDIDTFWSDEVIRGWFDMSQTFFITIDINNLFMEQVVMETPSLPRRYYTYERPIYPLIGEYGRLREYHAKYEQGVWVLSVIDNKHKNYVFNTYDHVNWPTTDAKAVSSKPFRHSRAHMLYIGTQIKS